MKIRACVASFLVGCAFLAGCGSPTALEKRASLQSVTPVHVEGSKPLGFYRVVFRVESGKAVGAYHDGLARIPYFEHRWQAGVSIGSDEFKIAASEELRSIGYSILGAENLLFGEDDSAKARYQLGGLIDDIQYNTYAPLAGDFSEANVSVEWQLRDSLRDETILTSRSEGYAKEHGITPAVVLSAFRAALRQLASQDEFVAATKDEPEPDTDGQPAFAEVLEIKGPRQEHSQHLPENMEDVLDCVVVLPVGNTHGSGSIISQDGYILTAAHVVSGVVDVPVRMRSGLELPAKVLRVDKAQDIALLKVEGRGYHALDLATADLPSPGAELYAIGAPASEDLSFSVSKGIVSAYRELGGFKYIQTDASLNPGNSGGPLLNEDGQLVGVVSWKMMASGFEGLSFGIPTNVIASRLNIKFGEGREQD